MYVIFPAEQIVECTLSRGIHTNLRQSNLQTTNLIGEQQEQYQHNLLDFESYQQKRLAEEELQALTKSLSKSQKKSSSSVRRAATSPPTKMAAGNAASGSSSGGGDVSLRDLHHPSLNEALKTHNGVTFKLVRTVSDFTQQLSQIYEQHAEELQLLVSNFRKRNSELRKERPNCPSSLFHTWETLLQEVEIDSQAHSDISLILGRQVSRPLLERSFHRKIQSRKVFTHRENFEAMLNKAEDKLGKCRQDYKSAYLSYISSPSSAAMASYLDHHNAYVQQLSLTNAMLEQYHQETLPQLLQELEEIYTDLCSTLSEAVLQGAEIISARAVEQSSRYDSLTSQCKSVASPVDLAHFVRSMTIPHTYPHRPALRHNFVTPQPPTPEVQDGAPLDGQQQPPPVQRETMNPPPPSLKNEIIIDRLATLPVRSKHEALKKEAQELETQIKQLNDALDTLLRIQQRSLESNLYNKANELQEDISMKRFDVRATQIKLMGANAQKDLFASKVENAADSGRDRKMSSSSTGSMKTKWLKAFKSLKTTSGPSPASTQPDKKNGGGKGGDANGGLMEAVAHSFQEYTYKKITPCDVCSQVLRGHTRQGMRCRVCKINVHLDCQASATRCQQKSRLLRRQKSTSEIDTRLQEHPSGAEEENVNSSLVAASGSLASDTYRRRRLFAGMKSFSVFASRSRSDSQSRSISLPEKHGPGSACGTRPFGQPLCLSEAGAASLGGENGPATPGVARAKSKALRYSK